MADLTTVSEWWTVSFMQLGRDEEQTEILFSEQSAQNYMDMLEGADHVNHSFEIKITHSKVDKKVIRVHRKFK